MRELKPDRDLDFLVALLAHPEVMRHWPAPLTPVEAAAWIQKQLSRYEQDGFGYWLVSLKESDTPIGQAGLMSIEIDGEAEIGLGYIIHADHWGRGYATEAGRACLHYGFEKLHQSRIVAPVRPANEPSIRVALRLDMTREKTTMFAGLEHDTYVLNTGAAKQM